MKRTVLHFAIVFCASLFVPSASPAQIIQRRGATWVGLKPNELFRLKRYEVTEEINPATLLRIDYIKRKKDKKSILFYTHGRGIVVTLGHAAHLLLINDNEASKSNRVVVFNLDTNETKRVDIQAIESYKRNASPDGRMIIIPEAYAFSPTDKQMLIKMELIYLSLPFEERGLANRLRRSYKPWWYVVDSIDGKVTHEYRTSRLPKRWWKY
jgi:hypothetical protein